MEDRIATLERAAEGLQQQLHEINVRYTALRAAMVNIVPDLLAGQGLTPEALAADRERLISTAHWSTVGGVSPEVSDKLTDAVGEEIGGLYEALIKNFAAIDASKVSASPVAGHDPMAAEIGASFGARFTEEQASLVAFIIRREVEAAISSEARALLTFCEREARWTVDGPGAKLVLQRMENFARSRLDPPRPSFFTAFST